MNNFALLRAIKGILFIKADCLHRKSGINIQLVFYPVKLVYMYPLNELLDKKPASKKKSKETDELIYIRKKLRTYIAENNNAKDLRLLECHAHCFISLS